MTDKELPEVIETEYGRARRKRTGPFYYVSHRGSPVPIHKLVYEKTTRTRVPKGHVVRHIDGDTTNNHISNLFVVSISQEKRMRGGWLISPDGQWTHKPCAKCKQVKPILLFQTLHYTKGTVLQNYCAPCRRIPRKKTGPPKGYQCSSYREPERRQSVLVTDDKDPILIPGIQHRMEAK